MTVAQLNELKLTLRYPKGATSIFLHRFPLQQYKICSAHIHWKCVKPNLHDNRKA